MLHELEVRVSLEPICQQLEFLCHLLCNELRVYCQSVDNIKASNFTNKNNNELWFVGLNSLILKFSTIIVPVPGPSNYTIGGVRPALFEEWNPWAVKDRTKFNSESKLLDYIIIEWDWVGLNLIEIYWIELIGLTWIGMNWIELVY